MTYIFVLRGKQSPNKAIKGADRARDGMIINEPSSNSTSHYLKSKNKTQHPANVHQRMRGRSLTRQPPVKANAQVIQDTTDHITIRSNSRKENFQSDKMQMKRNRSPAKPLKARQETLPTSRASPTKSKTPNRDQRQKTPSNTHTEIKDTHYISRSTSHDISVPSSREPTPKAPSISDESTPEEGHDRNVNIAVNISISTPSRTINGKPS